MTATEGTYLTAQRRIGDAFEWRVSHWSSESLYTHTLAKGRRWVCSKQRHDCGLKLPIDVLLLCPLNFRVHTLDQALRADIKFPPSDSHDVFASTMDEIKVTSTARQVQAACGYDGSAAFKWERFNACSSFQDQIGQPANMQ